MRLDRFDLNLLVVLDALLEECNVTRASERLHIGQSGASAALRRLRDHFGDELLVQTGRQLVLTPLAQSLVEPVRETLRQVRSTIVRRQGFDPATESRRFRISASDYVTTVLLAAAIESMATEAPGVTFEISSPPRDVPEAFDRGEIDLLVLPEQYASKIAHPQEAVFSDSQVCVVWSGSPQASQPMSFDAYMDAGHVAVRFGDPERSVMFEEWFLPRYGRQRRVECHVDNFSSLAPLLVGTHRIVTVHRLIAEHFVRHFPLSIVEAPVDMPPVLETMVWPAHLQHDPAHVWLRDKMRAAAAQADRRPQGLARGGEALAGPG